MGCDIHAFLEIESGTAGEYDSLYEVQFHLPRHYELFAALAGVRGELKPLYPPRGIPTGLGVYGFHVCYRQVVCHTDALGYRGSNFVLPYEVGRAQILPGSIGERWGASKLGYVINNAMEAPTWLLLSELEAVTEYAGLHADELPAEYRFLLSTMAAAEATFGRRTRIVLWFDSV